MPTHNICRNPTFIKIRQQKLMVRLQPAQKPE